MICGHGRHGKDTFCEIIRDRFGLTFIDSSREAAEVVYEVLRDRYDYQTLDQCYDDRANHRQEWFDEIARFNDPDPTQLARRIYSKSDIYCGIRKVEEFKAVKAAGLFDLSIWIDASERHPEESGSCTVTQDDCDLTITNNGTIEQLREKVERVLSSIIDSGSEKDDDQCRMHQNESELTREILASPLPL